MESRKKTLLALYNPEESDALREGYTRVLEQAVTDLDLPDGDLSVGLHIGGHGAAFETIGLLTALGSVYGYYELAKKGIEVAKDAKGAVDFVRKLPGHVENIKAKASKVFEKETGQADANVLSMSVELAALIAIAHVLEQIDPSNFALFSTKSYPDMSGTQFEGIAATYDYLYQVEIVVDNCVEMVFIDHGGALQASTHIIDWSGTCEHGRTERVTQTQTK